MTTTWIVIVSVAAGGLTLAAFLRKVVIPATNTVATGMKKISALVDLLLTGRPTMIDDATGERLPEVLPLPQALAKFRTDLDDQGRSLDELRVDVSDLTSVLNTVADQQAQLAVIFSRLDGIDTAVGLLIGSTYERGSEKYMAATELIQRHADPKIEEQ